MDHLYHHGILGQRWGIRRFQNKDGTLTSKGRARLYKEADKKRFDTDINDESEKRYKEHINNQINKSLKDSTDEYDIIKKGTSFDRIANSGEKVDGRRKYVSMIDADKQQYRSMAEMLNLDLSKPVSQYSYKANKDMKVYKAKAEDILKEIGDQKNNRLL